MYCWHVADVVYINLHVNAHICKHTYMYRHTTYYYFYYPFIQTTITINAISFIYTGMYYVCAVVCFSVCPPTNLAGALHLIVVVCMRKPL